MKKTGRKKRVIAIRAQSSKTKIAHVFRDLEQVKKLARIYTKKRLSQEQQDFVNSQTFANHFAGLDRSLYAPTLIWNKPVYRVTVTGINPLSIAGNLADGGRFNVGGAQQNPHFSNYKKCGCLYAAEDINCALREYSNGTPTGVADQYELTPKRELLLWDLQSVLSIIANSTLDTMVKQTPVEAIWGYQKIPLVSQVLGGFLRSLGGDGIAFPSTKVPTSLNLAFFFKTDEECKNTFSVRKL